MVSINQQNTTLRLENLQKSNKESVQNKQNNVAFGSEKDPNANSPKRDIFKKGDTLLPSDSVTNTKVAIENASSLPEYAVRGLKGDQNADFHERLSLANIPYYLGGPTLVWCFSAGIKESVPKVKQMAAGVALYYAGIAVANKLIDTPVKMFRGVDLNQNYRDVVDLSVLPTDGSPTKKIQYKKAIISCDWPRTDLLYNNGPESLKNPRAKNAYFDYVAHKMGAEDEQNDSDSSVKPNMKKLVIMSRAWKYALAVPMIALSAGMASNEVWTVNRDIKGNLKKLDNLKGMAKIKEALNVAIVNPFLKPLKTSFTDFFKYGLANKNMLEQSGKLKRQAGKATIIATAAMVVFANLNILAQTSLKKKKLVDVHGFADAPKNTPSNSSSKEVQKG